MDHKLAFLKSLTKQPTKNWETDDILALLEDGYTHEAELAVDAIITKIKEDERASGFSWGKFHIRGW